MAAQEFPDAFPLAPLPADGVAAALRPFGASRMLPPAAYTSAEAFAWERRHSFGDGWTCAGHASLVPAPGDQRAVSTGAGGAILVRGAGTAVPGPPNGRPRRHKGDTS